jgi:trans-aconitate methyltransferase
MSTPQTNAHLVELAWDEAARGYDAYFGPRFAPYLGAAVGALLAHGQRLPSGAVVVPCAGPGRELGPLAHAFTERSIVASDLSNEMVKVARERTAGLSNVSVERGDATSLSAPVGGAAALLSVFGLQLLPKQPETLASWIRMLSPGGLSVIVYWPRDTEASGPFHSMHRLLGELGMRDGAWESELVPSAVQAGGRVLADVRAAFEMQHDDADTVWHALTRLGPLRGLALARGQALVDALGATFVAELPRGPLRHTPEARLLVIERR